MLSDELLQAIITIGASQAFTLGLLISLKRKRGKADIVLAVVFFLLFVLILLFNYRNELNAISPGLGLYSMILAYAVIPLTYGYVKMMVNTFLWPVDLKHAIPFVIALAIMLWFFYPLPESERLAIARDFSRSKEIWCNIIYYGLFALVFPLYTIFSIRTLNQHSEKLKTRLSNIDEESLEWLAKFLRGLFIVCVIFLVFEVGLEKQLEIFGNDESDLAIVIPFLALVGLIVYAGISALRQKIIFVDTEVNNVISNKPKYEFSNLTEEKSKKYLDTLIKVMEAQRPYLEPKLTIGELSQKVGIPSNDLSRLINENLNQNFFDFVNSYRVKEFQILAKKPGSKQYTLLSLAYDSGFNSKSTFNAIFKKITGMTPSQWMNS
ncbi:MAG: helix-turn-helix domain-containing protein [Bacteroidia bacterium]|nr:helix-turn-helix domain-containing protein [Bacteroidia bacterium]